MPISNLPAFLFSATAQAERNAEYGGDPFTDVDGDGTIDNPYKGGNRVGSCAIGAICTGFADPNIQNWSVLDQKGLARSPQLGMHIGGVNEALPADGGAGTPTAIGVEAAEDTAGLYNAQMNYSVADTQAATGEVYDSALGAVNQAEPTVLVGQRLWGTKPAVVPPPPSNFELTDFYSVTSGYGMSAEGGSIDPTTLLGQTFATVLHNPASGAAHLQIGFVGDYVGWKTIEWTMGGFIANLTVVGNLYVGASTDIANILIAEAGNIVGITDFVVTPFGEPYLLGVGFVFGSNYGYTKTYGGTLAPTHDFAGQEVTFVGSQTNIGTNRVQLQYINSKYPTTGPILINIRKPDNSIVTASLSWNGLNAYNIDDAADNVYDAIIEGWGTEMDMWLEDKGTPVPIPGEPFDYGIGQSGNVYGYNTTLVIGSLSPLTFLGTTVRRLQNDADLGNLVELNFSGNAQPTAASIRIYYEGPAGARTRDLAWQFTGYQVNDTTLANYIKADVGQVVEIRLEDLA